MAADTCRHRILYARLVTAILDDLEAGRLSLERAEARVQEFTTRPDPSPKVAVFGAAWQDATTGYIEAHKAEV